jgi:hypothetical protein
MGYHCYHNKSTNTFLVVENDKFGSFSIPARMYFVLLEITNELYTKNSVYARSILINCRQSQNADDDERWVINRHHDINSSIHEL